MEVILLANKRRHKALFYPGSGSRRIIPYVLLVWIDFDGVVTMARSQSLRGSNRNGEVCVARVSGSLHGCLSRPYIGDRVSSANPFRGTIERRKRFPYANVSLYATYHSSTLLELGLRHRHVLWAFGLQCVFFDIPVLGCT